MTRNRPVVITAFSALTVLAIVSSPVAHEATAAEPFGPVESASFLAKPGTAIELPPADCHWNHDYFFIKGPNVAAAKQVDLSPKIWSRFMKNGGVPTSDCAAPNCAQVYLSVDNNTAPGRRTVTLKHADGRTVTTTLDVVPSAGRCDRR